MDLKKITRDMAEDEKEIFLSIFEELQAKAIEEARKRTAKALEKQRAEKAKEARGKLPQVLAELSAAQEQINQWFTAHKNEPIPAELRSRKDRQIRERARLEALIKQAL